MDSGMETAQGADRKNGRRAKAIPQDPQAEHQEVIKTLLKTFTHFFGDIDKRLGNVPDPRRPQRPEDIDYSMGSALFAGVLIFACRLGARRQVGLLLNTIFLVETFKQLFSRVDGVPHGDTINNIFCKADVGAVQEIVAGMTETLIDKKVLYSQRLFGRYHVVAVDATGMLTYKKRHCRYCLSKKHKSQTLYYHHVLEAKIVTPSGMVFSLMSEFIENPADDESKSMEERKQDCELKAFYRLSERLHARFPKLPIHLAMDGLYAVGPVFGICERYNWNFTISMSDEQLSTVNQEFDALCAINPLDSIFRRLGEKREVSQRFRWANGIDYIDTNKDEHTLSVLECIDTRPGKEEGEGDEKEEKITKFKWLTNVKVTSNNAVELANEGGRLRWKIENEGFNVQKNGGYELEHAYSNDQNAIKVYYLLLQIAHTLMQLVERGSLFRTAFPRGFGSAKNLAFRILEALRNAALSNEAYRKMRDERIQIRFAPP